ncbi:I78 family peptidase inhibitor [Agrobacterium bohemicum]|uniref:I78 family peptidase inhibitor n=1 Tax=Agrobacterium bohemicum TaxID=2052828 RepID=UPI0009E7A54A|nr:I78 family peptidase inhibitor [Agrobacterium bohemicum]
MKTLRVTLLVSCGTALVTCSTGHEVTNRRCDPAAARSLIGEPRQSDEEARQRTGATIVRQIAPGQPVTHDSRDNRLTLETDLATGRVIRATCG